MGRPELDVQPSGSGERDVGISATESPGFVRNKLSDLVRDARRRSWRSSATLASARSPTRRRWAAVLEWLGIPQLSGTGRDLRGVSMLVSVLVSWLLFTWMIARLPREPVSCVSSIAGRSDRGDRLRAVQAGGVDLPAVGAAQPGGRHVRAGVGPDGVRLHHRSAGPVRHRVGRHRVRRSARQARSTPRAPAIIAPRVQLDEGLNARQTLTAMAVGAVGALALFPTGPTPQA